MLSVWTGIAEQFLGVPVGSISGTDTGIGSLRKERIANESGIVEASSLRASFAFIGSVVEDGSFRRTLDSLAIICGGIEGLTLGALLESRFTILVVLVPDSIFGAALALLRRLVVEGH